MSVASKPGRLALSGGLALAAMVLLLTVVAAARADVVETIIDRCTHGESVSGFSEQDYRKALQELPTEVEEYSPCGGVIRGAQLAAAAGGNSGSGSGSTPGGGPTAATPLTPAERTVLKSVPKTGSAPQQVGSEIIHPGVVHADIASALSSLPTPLLTILAFLLACALVLAGGALRNRVRARRSR